MFSALTDEFRVVLHTILDNQTNIAEEMKSQNERLEIMSAKIDKIHDKVMRGMKALQTAFEQIKTVAEYLDDSVCEGLGRMSHMSLDSPI